MKLLWTRGAQADLIDAYDRIAEDDEPAAQRILVRIRAAMDLTKKFPDIGRVVPEFSEPMIRERVVRPYRIVYERRTSEVRVLAVVHTKRNMSDVEVETEPPPSTPGKTVTRRGNRV